MKYKLSFSGLFSYKLMLFNSLFPPNISGSPQMGPHMCSQISSTSDHLNWLPLCLKCTYCCRLPGTSGLSLVGLLSFTATLNRYHCFYWASLSILLATSDNSLKYWEFQSCMKFCGEGGENAFATHWYKSYHCIIVFLMKIDLLVFWFLSLFPPCYSRIH